VKKNIRVDPVTIYKSCVMIGCKLHKLTKS